MGQNTGISKTEKKVQNIAIRVAFVIECLQTGKRGYNHLKVNDSHLPELEFSQPADEWSKLVAV